MLVKALGSAFGDEGTKDENIFEQKMHFYCLNDTWLKNRLPNALAPDSQ